MLKLSSKLRQEIGHKNEAIRKQGLVPAILYGYKIKNISLSVKELDFERIYKEAGESTLIKLSIKAGKDESVKDRMVLVNSISRDPVSEKVVHIDFYQVNMEKTTAVEVPLVFVGKSNAVETDKGVLIRNIQVVEIEALPQDLPAEIEVDISVLKTFDDHIYIKDLNIPEKTEIKNNPEDLVTSVIPPRTSAELEDLEEAPVESVEEVEVEEKGKKLDESEESSETKKEGGKPAEEESASEGN